MYTIQKRYYFQTLELGTALSFSLYEIKISTRIKNTGKMFVLIFPLKCMLKQNTQVIISNTITFLMIFKKKNNDRENDGRN